MLDEVLNEVVTALRGKGVHAVRDYPGECFAGRSTVCVGAEKCSSVSAGLGDYIGVRSGLGEAGDRELYGRRLELVLSFEVFCGFDEGVEGCTGLSLSLGQLLEELPRGISCDRLETGEVTSDESMQCFRSKSLLYCTAFLEAESSGDEGDFLDFRLKGTMKNAE